MTDARLPSWRDGAARTAIVDFLAQVDDIAPDRRVAVFDNDGTLMCERPNYAQLDFMFAELGRAVGADPGLADREEYRVLRSGDRTAMGELGLVRIATALVDLFTGLEPEAFDAMVASFLADGRHPDRGTPYRQTRYRPMLELVGELRRRRFDVYVVTGGGAEFVRCFAQDFYGVPPEGVVGTQIDYELARRDDGAVRLVRTGRLVGTANEGAAKPPNIQRILGRRPVVAAGNSAGDAEMLDYARSSDGPTLALLVDHDDAEREYEYSGEAATFETDEPILETARRSGWTVVSMRSDWSTVFAGP